VKVPQISLPTEKKASGIACQLLNPIDDAEAEVLINDPRYCGQEKFNGKRTMLNRKDKVIAINKKGLECSFPEVYRDAVESIITRKGLKLLTLDGEDVSMTYHVFDVLDADKDLRDKTYRERYEILKGLLTTERVLRVKPVIQLAYTAFTTEEKRALYNDLKARKREGMVFKLLDGKFKAGRPASGGDHLKNKFYATASFIVIKANVKSSVAIGLLDDGTVVDVGNCTIPQGTKAPAKDSIIEIRYLYAHKGGSVYQPVYIGPRDDVSADECLLSQLKYKPDDED